MKNTQIKHKRHRSAAPYKAALQWLIDYDDVTFLDDEEDGIISVTASLLAYIYDRTEEELIADLRKLRANSET